MNELTKPQARRLATLEKQIEKGKGAFLQVGCALLEIREMRLYRGTHATFAAYCAERWKLSKSAAYRLLTVAEVGHNLSRARDESCQDNSPISGRAAVALAGLPEDVQQGVFAETAKKVGGDPTSEQLRAAVEQWKDSEAAAVRREEEERLSERKTSQSPARGVLDRMGELVGRLEKLIDRLDLAEDPEGNQALAGRLRRLRNRLTGMEKEAA